ncbi:hypothetical protein BDR26DRAFT_1004280 [Obelidium mucronatum]|nr:hypothetical protein BDR26DRAFT_1004280 [Obelidium mucronatum]
MSSPTAPPNFTAAEFKVLMAHVNRTLATEFAARPYDGFQKCDAYTQDSELFPDDPTQGAECYVLNSRARDALNAEDFNAMGVRFDVHLKTGNASHANAVAWVSVDGKPTAIVADLGWRQENRESYAVAVTAQNSIPVKQAAPPNSSQREKDAANAQNYQNLLQNNDAVIQSQNGTSCRSYFADTKGNIAEFKFHKSDTVPYECTQALQYELKPATDEEMAVALSNAAKNPAAQAKNNKSPAFKNFYPEMVFCDRYLEGGTTKLGPILAADQNGFVIRADMTGLTPDQATAKFHEFGLTPPPNGRGTATLPVEQFEKKFGKLPDKYQAAMAQYQPMVNAMVTNYKQAVQLQSFDRRDNQMDIIKPMVPTRRNTAAADVENPEVPQSAGPSPQDAKKKQLEATEAKTKAVRGEISGRIDGMVTQAVAPAVSATQAVSAPKFSYASAAAGGSKPVNQSVDTK